MENISLISIHAALIDERKHATELKPFVNGTKYGYIRPYIGIGCQARTSAKFTSNRWKNIKFELNLSSPQLFHAICVPFFSNIFFFFCDKRNPSKEQRKSNLSLQIFNSYLHQIFQSGISIVKSKRNGR